MKELSFDSINQHNLNIINKVFKEHGTVIIRGLQLNSLDFEAFTENFCNKFLSISSRCDSKSDIGDGFTSCTNIIKHFSILAHSESTYSPYPKRPDIGFLMCIQAPTCAHGGETSVGDGVEMLKQMPQELADRFIHQKVIYEYLWEPYRYQSQFGVKPQTKLIDLLDTLENVEYDFLGEKVHIFYKTSAVVKLSNGELSFANAILAHLPNIAHIKYKYPYTKATNQVYWENDEVLSQKDINTLIDVYDNIKYSHQWQEGDIVMFDNIRYMHSKEETIEECERVLLARFGYLEPV